MKKKTSKGFRVLAKKTNYIDFWLVFEFSGKLMKKVAVYKSVLDIFNKIDYKLKVIFYKNLLIAHT